MAMDEIAVSTDHSLRKLYQEFGGCTTMHGIGRVISNNSTWKRVVWSAMFLLGVGFSVYQFVITVDDFYNYPVTTMVTLTHESRAMFPSVTVCNLNKNRKSMISSYLKTETHEYNQPEISPYDTFLNVAMAYDSMTLGLASAHQLSDMLIACVFNRMLCEKYDFIELDAAAYGACYTFDLEDPLLQYVNRPGLQNGLILELNIEQYEYMSITSTAGVKVIVHPRDEIPFSEEGGILAQLAK